MPRASKLELTKLSVSQSTCSGLYPRQPICSIPCVGVCSGINKIAVVIIPKLCRNMRSGTSEANLCISRIRSVTFTPEISQS
jgi:hypothetical protein